MNIISFFLILHHLYDKIILTIWNIPKEKYVSIGEEFNPRGGKMKAINIKKKTLVIIFAVLVLLAALALAYVLIINSVIVNGTKGKIHGPDSVTDKIDADCILILGAGIKDNGEPSDMLRDRLLTGIELYENGAAEIILVSGDNSRVDYDEVGVMEEFLIENGVPEDAIVKDHAGFSTYESLYRARDIFCAEKLIIVTQEYHLYRSLFVAEKLGLEAVGVSADLHTYRGQSYRELREILARNKDFLYTILKPLPTYLGEKIPIK